MTEKPGRPQYTGLQRVGCDRSDPVCLDMRLFLLLAALLPVRVECEGGTAVWLLGTLDAPSVQGHRLPLWQELWPHQSPFFKTLVADTQEASLALKPLSLQLLPFRHLEGSLVWGPSLLFSASGA